MNFSDEMKKKLRNGIVEVSNSKLRQESERDFQKDVIDRLHEELEIDKKHIRQVATLYHKQNYAEVLAQNEEVSDLYTSMYSYSYILV